MDLIRLSLPMDKLEVVRLLQLQEDQKDTVIEELFQGHYLPFFLRLIRIQTLSSLLESLTWKSITIVDMISFLPVRNYNK